MEYMLRVLIDDSLSLEEDRKILEKKYNAVELSYDEDSGRVDYRIETDGPVDVEDLVDDFTSIELISLDDLAEDDLTDTKEVWEI